MQYYSVSDIADQVHQDVLLMAGDEDYMIPLKELQKHQEGLVNARTITRRIFSEDEHAENHCQVGNIKLALDVILDWIIHTYSLDIQTLQGFVTSSLMGEIA